MEPFLSLLICLLVLLVFRQAVKIARLEMELHWSRSRERIHQRLSRTWQRVAANRSPRIYDSAPSEN